MWPDPPPSTVVGSTSPLQMMQSKLQQFFDDETFSDITFVVEDKEIHAHRIVLTTMCERFRALFSHGAYSRRECLVGWLWC
jgi:hypothetical protein